MGDAWPRKMYVGVAGGNFCFWSGWLGAIAGDAEFKDIIRYRK